MNARTPLIVVALAALPVSAQNGPADGTAIEIGERFVVHSDVLGEERPVLVGLPAGYEESDEPYPVLYLLDGRDHFHHTTGSVRFLAGNNRMPRVIVVGIPNLSGEGRTRDLTPPVEREEDRERFPTAGGAEHFLRFLTEELRPWVDARYRTRDFDILVGHSFGGLFVTEVLDSEPSAFDAYISISPSLWWDGGEYVERVADLFDRHPEARGSLYMTMADEGGDMLAGAWDFAGTLEMHAPKSFRWQWRHMPTENHGTIPHRTTYDGLEWTFDGWDPMPILGPVLRGDEPAGPAMEALAAHYRDWSERMGWEIEPPYELVADVGEYVLEEGRTEDGLAVFTALLRWFPQRPASHRWLARALTAACRWDEARTHLGHARSRAEAAGDEEGVARADRGFEALEEAVSAGTTCGAAGGSPARR